jgi:RNA polymerase sigma factor (TIGR02999 family)
MSMSAISQQQITSLLMQWSQGDEHALDQLTPLIYQDLRRLASYLLRGERPQHTLQPTALVNEAYLRLANDNKVTWQNRNHFFAVAARVMRHILVDYARFHQRAKRGGGVALLPLDEVFVFAPEASSDLLALNDALDRLGQLDPRKARVVELRFFGGLTVEETADVLQLSPNTILRDWNMAKAWLKREISNDEYAAGPRAVEAG